MKVLLDGCVWGGAAGVLAHAGHEVESVADWSRDPGDHEILSRAFQASQVVVTIDKDFGELAVVHRLPHEGIIRLVGLAAAQQGTITAEVLAKYNEELERGRDRDGGSEPGSRTAGRGRLTIYPRAIGYLRRAHRR